MRALGAIGRELLGNGMPADMPVAIIENGCSPEQRVTRAPLNRIAAVAVERGVAAPAVIVIGRVVDFADAA